MALTTASSDSRITHGGFYAHFSSREALLAEAADRAGASTLSTMVGALLLARAVDDPRLSDAIREAALRY